MTVPTSTVLFFAPSTHKDAISLLKAMPTCRQTSFVKLGENVGVGLVVEDPYDSIFPIVALLSPIRRPKPAVEPLFKALSVRGCWRLQKISS